MLELDYNERVSHEMLAIPISFYHLDSNHPCYFMPTHWHHPLEIARVVSGKLNIYLNGEKTSAAPGDIIFIGQEIIHSYFPVDCVYEVIDLNVNELLLRTAFCKDILQVFADGRINILPIPAPGQDQNDPCFQADPDSLRNLHQLASRLFTTASEHLSDNSLLVLGTLFELLGTIYAKHHYTKISGHSEDVNFFKPLLSFVEHSYMKPITLTEMAQVSGMSTSYFSVLFREFFRQTPIDYLNSYRIERAGLLLTNSDLPVSEVAYRCGFNDCPYFVNVFKKYKNITPKKYRNLYKTEK